MTAAIVAIVVLGVCNIALIGLVSSLAKRETPSQTPVHYTDDEDGIK